MDSGEPVTFRTGEVSAGGRRRAYREAGSGVALVAVAAADGVTRAAELLAVRHRVIAFTADMMAPDAAPGIADAAAALDLAHYDLLGQGTASRVALRIALEPGTRARSLILLGPTLIAPDGTPADAADAALVGRLGELAVPTLAVFGTRDQAAPIEAARHYRARMPGCNLVYVYDAGAAMADERPEAVAALIADFLERHDLFLVRRDSDVIYP